MTLRDFLHDRLPSLGAAVPSAMDLHSWVTCEKMEFYGIYQIHLKSFENTLVDCANRKVLSAIT